MKKLITLLLTVTFLSACSSDIEPVKSPRASTTLELQQAEGNNDFKHDLYEAAIKFTLKT